MSFIIKDLSYIHADKEILFSHLHLSINSGDKIALTGNNGCGKSTLMRILVGDLSPSSGTVLRPEHLYYVPQHFGQYDRQTIAQALGISHKLSALHAILSGDATESTSIRSMMTGTWKNAPRLLSTAGDWTVSHSPVRWKDLAAAKRPASSWQAWSCTTQQPSCWTNRPTIWTRMDGNVCIT